MSLSSEHSFGSADAIVLDGTSSSRVKNLLLAYNFFVPCFSYLVEIQLQAANTEFRANGTHLGPSPKLRMDILEGMAEAIFKYTAYPNDSQIEDAAAVLVHTHPCLRQRELVLATRDGNSNLRQRLPISAQNFARLDTLRSV